MLNSVSFTVYQKVGACTDFVSLFRNPRIYGCFSYFSHSFSVLESLLARSLQKLEKTSQTPYKQREEEHSVRCPSSPVFVRLQGVERYLNISQLRAVLALVYQFCIAFCLTAVMYLFANINTLNEISK